MLFRFIAWCKRSAESHVALEALSLDPSPTSLNRDIAVIMDSYQNVTSEAPIENYPGFEGVFAFNFSAAHTVSVESVICWSIIATTIMIIAGAGNIIVIWIVMTNPRMRTVTNYFLLNLAVADTMIATIDMPSMFTYIVTDNWPFGLVGCKIAKFVANLSAVASILSLMAVTVDRFRAIVHPLLPRLPKRVIIGSVISIWIVAAAWTSPRFFFAGQYKFIYSDGTERVHCYIIWPPDGQPYGSYDVA